MFNLNKIKSLKRQSEMGFRKPDEIAFMNTVIQLARLMGWKCYHQNDSRQSESGFPDLVIWRDGDYTIRLFVVELKTNKGETTAAQDVCLSAFQYHIGESLARVMRPRDWPEIEQMLRDRT